MLNVMNKFIYTLLIMLCVAALPAAAQERTAPALPPDAQQAFDRGLKAVKQQEWGLATRYFSDAQKTAPYASTVLFNLGLAHARAGHELPAIAWLHAYLAVTPQAPNAEAIRAEIERLKTVMRGKMNAIFQTAITAAQQLREIEKYRGFLSIAGCQADVGDVEGAIATWKLDNPQGETSRLSNLYWSAFSKALIRAGDLEGAQEALKNVTETEDQMEVTKLIGEVARRKENIKNHKGVAKEYVDDWCRLAQGFSTDERTCNLEKTLKDAAEAKDHRREYFGETALACIENIARVARSLGIALNKISVLERKSGKERGGK